MEVIVGKVEKGRGVGRIMGYPTLNIFYNGVERGVFAAMVSAQGKEYLAAVNLGGRPTFGDDAVLCEAFLLSFEGDVIEDLEVVVRLLKKVREIKKFSDMESLAAQISRDVEVIKNWYNAGELK